MKCFKYNNRQKSYITVILLDDPYGEGTETVVSIGCTLKGDMQNPTWKVHVPLHLAESVGQELIRLARPDKSPWKVQSAPVRRITSAEASDSPPIQEATLNASEISSLSARAVEMGRVIKRTGGDNAKKKA